MLTRPAALAVAVALALAAAPAADAASAVAKLQPVAGLPTAKVLP